MNNAFFLDNFNTAWASAAKGNKYQVKGLPARHEMRELVVEFLTTIKQGASSPATTFKIKPNDGTASGGTDDCLTIMNGFLNRLYLKRDKKSFAYNVDATEVEILYGGQHLCAVYGEQVRDGDAIPINGGTAINLRLKATLSFLHEAFETPNLLTPGTEQCSLDGGWELSYDAGTIASLTLFAIGNGNVVLTTPTVSVHADLAPVPWPIVGPTWYAKEDTFSNNKDEFFGPALELLFYDKRLPVTMETNVAYINVKNDDIDSVSQQTPSQMAQAWLRAQKKLDGIRPFDLSRNCTPIRFPHGKILSEERELPFTVDRRIYNQQLASGGSAASTVVRHYVEPLESNPDSIKRVMAGLGYSGDWRAFPVRFPGRDKRLERFKAREIRPVDG